MKTENEIAEYLMVNDFETYKEWKRLHIKLAFAKIGYAFFSIIQYLSLAIMVLITFSAIYVFAVTEWGCQ